MRNALCHQRNLPLSRRAMLQQSAAGFGALAFHGLLSQAHSNSQPLAPKTSLIAPKAKRVIFLFMHGGPSQVDLFDHKPELTKLDGKPLPFDKPRIVSSNTGNLLGSPFSFKQHGQSGAHVSELLPHIGKIVDDLCIVRSMHGSNSRHGGALLELHTGSDTFPRPSMGSWIQYGLGTENENLPGFLTINPAMGHGGANAWSSSFLPAHYQGTRIARNKDKHLQIPFIQREETDRQAQRQELAFLESMNQAHLARVGSDTTLEARLASYELAFRMQMEAPTVQDISSETASTRALYGLDDKPTRQFAEQCLLARRFSQAGVRFVQATHRYWDQHSKLKTDHTRLAAEMDKPVAGLITDLKQRGLLDETLVVAMGEMGRTPKGEANWGRGHWSTCFPCLIAGAGVRGGIVYGKTDDHAAYPTENPVSPEDLAKTIYWALGIDPDLFLPKREGRPMPIVDSGSPLTEIFG